MYMLQLAHQIMHRMWYFQPTVIRIHIFGQPLRRTCELHRLLVRGVEESVRGTTLSASERFGVEHIGETLIQAEGHHGAEKHILSRHQVFTACCCVSPFSPSLKVNREPVAKQRILSLVTIIGVVWFCNNSAAAQIALMILNKVKFQIREILDYKMF